MVRERVERRLEAVSRVSARPGARVGIGPPEFLKNGLDDYRLACRFRSMHEHWWAVVLVRVTQKPLETEALLLSANEISTSIVLITSFAHLFLLSISLLFFFFFFFRSLLRAAALPNGFYLSSSSSLLLLFLLFLFVPPQPVFPPKTKMKCLSINLIYFVP